MSPSKPRARVGALCRHLRVPVAVISAAAIVSGVAGAGTVTRVVGSASNSTLAERVVVDVHGRTLYALHPETTHHLLCNTRACLEAWPPLTVRSGNVSLVAGHGVEGHLGLLRRSNGKLQVTLRGMLLYRFSKDSGRDEANGEGIRSFGGTWHAVKATAKSSSAPAPSPPAMTPPPGYGY